ncbi:MAG: hypothetical protein K9M57_05510 [Phycisphaerae bacterium]|nr:hypothetical protein [Phycisphaerae bacterium]
MRNRNQKTKRNARKKSPRGIVSILTISFVVLFAVLAISFASVSNSNIHMSQNHRDMARAQAAAESGLEYARLMVNRYIDERDPRSIDNLVSQSNAMDVFMDLSDYIQTKLNATTILGNATITSPVTINEEGRTGRATNVPPIAFSKDQTAGFTLEIKQFNDTPDILEIVSTGAMGDSSQSASLKYRVIKDTRLLQFSIASKSRVIVTGDSTIEKGIFSEWTHTGIAPPIMLEAESTIDGDINTTLSKNDFPAEYVKGAYDQILYDQPDVDLPTADDFDTSMYKDMTKNLPNSGQRVTEYFPHADGDYTSPSGPESICLSRTVYGPADPTDPPLVINDRYLAAGGNSLFRNCIFEGVFYVGVGGGTGTNNIRFDNCTFKGPVITGVPPHFGPETWKKNMLYFTGDTAFDNQTTIPTTILAPNYNVNIGNTKALANGASSVLKGIVLGGVVDVRDNIQIDGTIVSMHYPDPADWGAAAGLVATNIGFSSENAEAGGNASGVIKITPQPDNLLPVGINSKYLIVPINGTYNEY